MRNLPSYEEFVGESRVGVVAADVVQGAKFKMRNGLVVSVVKVDPHGYPATMNGRSLGPDERTSVLSHVEGSGDRSGSPFRDSLKGCVEFLNDEGAVPLAEGWVNEASAAAIAVASDISDYQKNMSRETFDKLIDRVAANLDMHDKSKRKLLADHLANSLPRPDDDERLSRKDIAGLADEIVYGKWMGESRVDEYGTPTKHRDRLDKVRDAAEKAIGSTRATAFRKSWDDMVTRLVHSPSSLVDAEIDDFMQDVLSNYGLDLNALEAK